MCVTVVSVIHFRLCVFLFYLSRFNQKSKKERGFFFKQVREDCSLSGLVTGFCKFGCLVCSSAPPDVERKEKRIKIKMMITLFNFIYLFDDFDN